MQRRMQPLVAPNLSFTGYNKTEHVISECLQRYVFSRKSALARYFMASVCALLLSCSVVADRKDWDFIQSVGGIRLGGQDKNPDWLILRGDVSGLHEFTVKPKQVNSALALKKVSLLRENNELNIFIVTTLISSKCSNTAIEGVDISGIPEGDYIVQYKNMDGSVSNLGEVTIVR